MQLDRFDRLEHAQRDRFIAGEVVACRVEVERHRVTRRHDVLRQVAGRSVELEPLLRRCGKRSEHQHRSRREAAVEGLEGLAVVGSDGADVDRAAVGEDCIRLVIGGVVGRVRGRVGHPLRQGRQRGFDVALRAGPHVGQRE